MRKPRFLCIVPLLILLLFALALSACQTAESPPEEPPIEEPPAEEPPAEKPPLVIEQGEILVSDYWQNAPVATNPRPDMVEGTPLCFEQLPGAGSNGGKGLMIADDLAEASAIVGEYVWDDRGLTGSFYAVCDAVSHVDFSAFRLLVFFLGRDGGERLDFTALIHDGKGELTLMLAPTNERELLDYTVYEAYFFLVRRNDFPVNDSEAIFKTFGYRLYPDPIEPTETVTSDFWQDPTPGENERPDEVPGTSICFEDLGYYRLYEKFWREKADTLYCISDLEAAAYLIDAYAYGYGPGNGNYGVEKLRNKAAQVDFSQFYMLVLIERHPAIYSPYPYTPTALVQGEDGDLTLMLYRNENPGQYAYPDEDLLARFVLVRRSDFNAVDGATFSVYTYGDPPNVIQPGEIVISALWDVIEHPTNHYKYYCDAPALQFEQLGMVAVEYKSGKDPVFADSLDEAAEAIDRLTSYDSAGCLALNEIASHVDFSQFRLLLIGERWYSTDRMESCYLDTLIYSSKNLHIVYNYYDLSGPEPGDGNGATQYVRMILIHRSQLEETPEFYQRHN